MNDCVKDYLTEIIVTSAAFGASFILNCLMACKLYYKPNTKEEIISMGVDAIAIISVRATALAMTPIAWDIIFSLSSATEY